MQNYIPEYSYVFPNKLPTGEKKYVYSFVKKMISEFVYDMSMLENNPFTFPEVQTLLEGVTVGGHRLSDQTQVLRIKDSWEHVQQMSIKDEQIIDKQLLCGIHEIVAKEEALIVGDFRNGNIGIAGTTKYQCIDADNLLTIFETNLLEINKILNPLERAIVLNLWLCYCQFFYDGNKRTARLISNLILLQSGVGVLSVPAKYKQEYNTLMIEFYDTLDGDKIMKFLVEKCITYFDGFRYLDFKRLIQTIE